MSANLNKEEFSNKENDSNSKNNNVVEFPNKNNINLIETNLVITTDNRQITNKYYSSDEKRTKLNDNKNSKHNVIDFEKYQKSDNGNLPPKPTIIAIIGILILSFVIWGFTNKNSQEVYVGDYKIGIIKGKDITSQEIKETALAKLRNEVGTNVEVNENIILKPVHSSKNELISMDYALSQITKKFTFKVEAASILVNGKEIAIVKNEEEANAILSQISSRYITEDTIKISEPTFVEDVKVESKYTSEDDIINSEIALEKLTANTSKDKKYEIKKGDTLYQIAIDYNMKLQDLLNANPDIKETTPLKIGKKINLIVPVPLLSVRTYEKIIYEEYIPKKIETISNDKEYKTYRKVISTGKDGRKEVTAKVTKVNGLEEGRKVISEKVLTEPTVEKVEVGTLNTPPKKAIGSFIYPVKGRLTSGFGFRWGIMHYGLDLANHYGSPIKASDGGTVVFSGWGNGYGNMIKIDHGNGFQTVYGHNSKNVVSIGQKVAQGEIIGYIGSTGNSTGNHLHFEIIKNGVKQNPLNYLK